MTRISDKEERRTARKYEKVQKLAVKFEKALLDWHSMKHEMFEEWKTAGVVRADTGESSQLSFADRRAIAQKTAGKRIRPFVRGEVLEPLEPVKVPKGVRLVLKDVDRKFKEPIVSPSMQRNLRVLELRLDTNGFLYSVKKFDPNWNWQTQAIWLRLIGMGYLKIAKKLKKSLNTVKSMFKRLNISNFFPKVSHYDWASIGYGAKAGETMSGWRTILLGGASGILYPASDTVINERTGQSTPKFLARFTIGETISIKRDGLLETESYLIERSQGQIKPFDFAKHKKAVSKRQKEATKRRKDVTYEQKVIEIENLQKSIEKGFDPETGRYKDDD